MYCAVLQDVYYEKDDYKSTDRSARSSRDAAMEEGQEVSMRLFSSSSSSSNSNAAAVAVMLVVSCMCKLPAAASSTKRRARCCEISSPGFVSEFRVAGWGGGGL